MGRSVNFIEASAPCVACGNSLFRRGLGSWVDFTYRKTFQLGSTPPPLPIIGMIYLNDLSAKKKIGTTYESRGERRGPGAAAKKDVDYDPFREHIGRHHRGYEDDKGQPVVSKGKSDFYLYRGINTVNAGELTLGTHVFDSNGATRTQSYPCGEDGVEIDLTATIKNRAFNGWLMAAARAQAQAQAALV